MRVMIGNPGDFTAAAQALGGGDSQYDLFLCTSTGDPWAATASAVPEPGRMLPMAAGPGLVGVGRRRRA